MENGAISLSDIEHLAEMSGLDFSDDEKVVMQGQVEGILDMLNGCAEADMVEECHSKSIGLAELRDDAVHVSLTPEQVFENTPNAHKGFIVVPKVVD